MMNRACMLLATLGIAAISARAGAQQSAPLSAEPWSLTVAGEARYYAWQSNRGTPATAGTARGSGAQLYIPYAMQVVGQPAENLKVEFLARGGWVHARQSTAGQTGEVNAATDTVASTTLTYLGLAGLHPFAALSVNIPTGRAALFGAAANARMDPDLVEIGSFGEGWNIGPTGGVTIPITDTFLVTTSFGYTWRGDFTRERSSAEPNPAVQSATSLDPGDVWTATLTLGHRSESFSASLTGALSEETATREGGIDLYRAGRRYMVTGTVSYRWPDRFGETGFMAAWSHANRNAVRFAGAVALIAELFNTNSNMYRVGLQHLIPVGPLAVGPTGNFLYRDNNGYDAGTLQFLPAKQRWAAGGAARYALSDAVALNARFEHVWVREDDRPAPNGMLYSVLLNDFVAGSAVPVVSSTGWVVAGGANIRF